MMLLQNETGIMYPDLVDLMLCQYTYTETDIPCEEEVEEIEHDFVEEEAE